MSAHESLPARLDRWIMRGPWRALSPPNATELADESLSERELVDQGLIGVWIVYTVVLGVGSLLITLLVDPPIVVAAILALLVAVPASMVLLRGVVDGFSPRGRLPKYTTSSLAFVGCYFVAAAGSLTALAEP